MDFFARHYEKLILAFCLLLLLCGIAFVGISAKSVSEELNKNQREANSSVKGGNMVEDVDTTGYNVEKYLNDPRKVCSILGDGDEESHKGSLIESEPLILCKGNGCSHLISLKASICSFCGTRQDELAKELTEKDDLDGDGIPDLVERKYPDFLNEQNPNDAGQDYDGDGFSNVEEIRAGTDPSDAKSFPPLVTLLRVVNVVRRPVPMKLAEVYKPRKGGEDKTKWEITLEMNKRRKGGIRIGDAVNGYKITDAGFEAVEAGGEVAYIEFSSVKSPEETYKVVVKETAYEKKASVTLYFLLSRDKGEVKRNKYYQVRCKEGGEFELSPKRKQEQQRGLDGGGPGADGEEPEEKKEPEAEEVKIEYYRLESADKNGTANVSLLKGKGGEVEKSYEVPKLDEEKDFTKDTGSRGEGFDGMEPGMEEPGRPGRRPGGAGRPGRKPGKGR